MPSGQRSLANDRQPRVNDTELTVEPGIGHGNKNWKRLMRFDAPDISSRLFGKLPTCTDLGHRWGLGGLVPVYSSYVIMSTK